MNEFGNISSIGSGAMPGADPAGNTPQASNVSNSPVSQTTKADDNNWAISIMEDLLSEFLSGSKAGGFESLRNAQEAVSIIQKLEQAMNGIKGKISEMREILKAANSIDLSYDNLNFDINSYENENNVYGKLTEMEQMTQDAAKIDPNSNAKDDENAQNVFGKLTEMEQIIQDAAKIEENSYGKKNKDAIAEANDPLNDSSKTELKKIEGEKGISEALKELAKDVNKIATETEVKGNKIFGPEGEDVSLVISNDYKIEIPHSDLSFGPSMDSWSDQTNTLAVIVEGIQKTRESSGDLLGIKERVDNFTTLMESELFNSLDDAQVGNMENAVGLSVNAAKRIIENDKELLEMQARISPEMAGQLLSDLESNF